MAETTQETPPEGWQAQRRPPLLTRRFEFGSYAETRGFLDALAQLSERTGRYPDLNFGRTHVSVSIAASGDRLAAAEFEFAATVSGLARESQA
jgi:pterin-4a-carbinolamine dehydratase